MPKPFISHSIERYAGVALVRIVRVTFTETGHKSEELECYETASRGATASARRSIRKLESR